ncbi:hypothetical protein Mapa_002068 [Marchantia paleacea]|nr:hypothetical protein Mapa_002068 [Marchantia paleacea]
MGTEFVPPQAVWKTEVPAWSDLVKTATFKELAPCDWKFPVAAAQEKNAEAWNQLRDEKNKTKAKENPAHVFLRFFWDKKTETPNY